MVGSTDIEREMGSSHPEVDPADLVIEPLGQDDLPFLLEVRNGCRECLHDNRVFALADCRKWFLETRPDFHIIRWRGKRIGYFRLGRHDPREGSIYVGADLHERFRRRGLAGAAYRSFLPRVKERYRVSRVRLEVLSHNTAARALYARLGFGEVGRKRAFAIRGGVPVDSIVMELAL